jgi:hypothetical protein
MVYTCLSHNAVNIGDISINTALTTASADNNAHTAKDALGTSGTYYVSATPSTTVIIAVDIKKYLYFNLTMIQYEVVSNVASVSISATSNSGTVWTSPVSPVRIRYRVNFGIA